MVRTILLFLFVLLFLKIVGQVTTDSLTCFKIYLNKVTKSEINGNIQISLLDVNGNIYTSDSTRICNVPIGLEYYLKVTLKGYFAYENKIFINSYHIEDTIDLEKISNSKVALIILDSITLTQTQIHFVKTFLSNTKDINCIEIAFNNYEIDINKVKEINNQLLDLLYYEFAESDLKICITFIQDSTNNPYIKIKVE